MRKSRRAARERLLVRLAELRDAPPAGGPEEAFRLRLRERLLASGSGAAGPAAAPARRGRRLSWLPRLVALGVAVMMACSAVLTYHSLPGEPLYPLKRAAEAALVRLSATPADRGERELASAKTRAEELNALLSSPERGPHVSATLDDMATSTRSGISRLPRSATIRKFARDQRNMVEPLLEQLEGSDHDKVNGYLQYIDGLAAPH